MLRGLSSPGNGQQERRREQNTGPGGAGVKRATAEKSTGKWC